MANQSTKLIIVLAGILLAVLVVSAVVLWGLPASDTPNPAETGTEAPATSTTTASSTGFNLKILQTSGYLSLDQKPISEGALPVQPPATSGKANPFL